MASLETAESVLQALRDGELAGSWVLDPDRSEIGLRSKAMWGLATVRGVFGQVQGAGFITPAGEVSGTLTIVAGSLDTKNRQRDTHLRSAAFFDVENYPEIVFTADRVEVSGQALAVAGILKVRDQARPVSIETRPSMAGSDELRLDGEIKVNRADFGLSWNQLGMASMDNMITVRAVFTRQ